MRLGDWDKYFWLLELKWKLRAFFITPFAEIFHWIVKSCQYAWFLRPGHDYDWDFAYILKLLRFKLIRTAKQIKENAIITDHQKVHDEIMALVENLDRVIEGDYINQELGELLVKSFPGKWIDRGKALTPTEDARLSELLEQSEADKRADWDLFFNTLRDRMQSFWD